MGHRPTEHHTHGRSTRFGAGTAAGAAGASIVLALASPAQAQEEWEHVHGSVDEGGSYTAVAATAADEVWAFGSDGEDTETPRLQRWDGQDWQEETAPDALTSTPVAADAGSDGQVWALAHSYDEGASAAHYDGEAWSDADIDPDLEPTALAATGEGNAWLLSGPVMGEPEAAYFDGQVWTPQPAPSVSAGLGSDEAGSVVAVGGQGEDLVVERWDGDAWVPEDIPEVDIPGGEPGASFNDVVVRSADDVSAVGSISWKDSDELNHSLPVLAQYDGTEWTVEVGEDEGSYEAVADDGQGGLYLSDGAWNPVLEHRTADGQVTRQEILAEDHDIVLGGLDSVPDGAGAVMAAGAVDKGDPDEPSGHGRLYGTGEWY